MAEWLRRLTRNQLGSSRVGSNPTRSGFLSWPHVKLEGMLGFERKLTGWTLYGSAIFAAYHVLFTTSFTYIVN